MAKYNPPMEKAARSIRFKAPEDSKIEDVTAWIADSVKIVGGFGGWETVARPRKTGMTIWRGYDPILLEIPIIIRTLSRDWEDGKRIEAECIALGMMAGRGEAAPEPQKKKGKVRFGRVKKGETWKKIAAKHNVDLADLLQLNSIKDMGKKPKKNRRYSIPQKKENDPFGEPPTITLIHDGALVPYNDIDVEGNKVTRRRWVIENIDWGESRRNVFGDRIRQNASVTVMQHVAPAYKATRNPPWRRNTTHSRANPKTRTRPTESGWQTAYKI